MKRLVFVIGLIGAVLGLAWFVPNEDQFSEDTLVADVQIALGMKKPLHYLAPEQRTPQRIKQGLELVTVGRTTDDNGNRTSLQSRFFKCTSCHNIEREDPDLKKAEPEARLQYSWDKGLPFLQGSTLYGIVDRETWYNDDYLVKYGDLVRSSRDTLANAIKLCAVECSQGRILEDWELEAMLAYFWSIGLKVKDLDLSEKEMHQIQHAFLHQGHGPQVIKLLKSKYYTASPATFIDPLNYEDRKMGKDGVPENGKKIFISSCLHCHAQGRYTKYTFEDSKHMHRKLKRELGEWTRFSTYFITRRGTHPYVGYTPYMPHYTLERMSHQQLEDLVSYINLRAE